jgi:hypothetical protein
VAAVAHPGTPRIAHEQMVRDWHNGYAELIIDLSHVLQNARTDADRLKLVDDLHGRLKDAGVSTAMPAHPIPPAGEPRGEPAGE